VRGQKAERPSAKIARGDAEMLTASHPLKAKFPFLRFVQSPIMPCQNL